jgi:glycosyltransferase involved in cell wall biosynthesis
MNEIENPYSKNHILALIPAYNESRAILNVVEQALTYLPVLVVDDGSVDGTPDLVHRTAASVVEVKPNQGKGNALKTGFQWALQHGYAGVITLDADGQHDPQEIPRFLEIISRHNPDLLIGCRDFSQMPFIRRLANSLGKILFSWAMRQPIRDNQSGYRYLSSALMEKTLDNPLSGFEFEVENILTCIQQQMKMEWIPIKTIYGDEKSHINPVKHTAGFIALLYRVRRATSFKKIRYIS